MALSRRDQAGHPGPAVDDGEGRQFFFPEGCESSAQIVPAAVAAVHSKIEPTDAQVVLTTEALSFSKMDSDKITECIPVNEVMLVINSALRRVSVATYLVLELLSARAGNGAAPARESPCTAYFE
jgi:hypothetical protein